MGAGAVGGNPPTNAEKTRNETGRPTTTNGRALAGSVYFFSSLLTLDESEMI